MARKIAIPDIQMHLVLQLLAVVIGILFLLFDNFAGFYYTIYEPRAYVWGFVNISSSFLAGVFIFIGIASLIYSLNYT